MVSCLAAAGTSTSSKEVQYLDYCTNILLPRVHLFRSVDPDFYFMDDNAPLQRILTVEELLDNENIERVDWPARISRPKSYRTHVRISLEISSIK